MITRSHLFKLGAAAALMSAVQPARGQDTDQAAAFVQSTGDKLAAIVNGTASAAAEHASMRGITNAAFDVDGIAEFCLGRFWRTATADQKTLSIGLFQAVLTLGMAARFGEDPGVKLTVVSSHLKDKEGVVSTLIDRPNSPPTAIDWVISNPTTNPKFIDVVTDGTSFRLTQRQKSATIMAHNGNNLDELLRTMQNRIAMASD